MSGKALRFYALAFSVVAVFAAVTGKEVISGTAIVCAVVITCTRHICRAIEGGEP